MNRLRKYIEMGACVVLVCAHSMPRQPAYKLQSVQFAIATSSVVMSDCCLAVAAIMLYIGTVNGSRRLGTDSQRFCSASTFAITGASLVSADEINLGSISRNRPRNFEISAK